MKNNIIILLTIIGLIIAGFTFYYQVIYQPKTIINIEKVSEVQLTQPLKIDGLKASYTFKDTIEVKNLWQTTFVLKNVGDKTIYGDGFEEKNIRNNYIPFEVIGCDNLLSASITTQNCDAFMMNIPKIVITQWRPKEYIEIKIITEGVSAPKLTISDREIKDSQITFSFYSPEENNEGKKVIEFLPKNTVNTLRWIVTIVVVFLLLIAIPQMRKQYIGIDGKGGRVFFVIFGGLFLLIMLMPFLWMF